MRIKNPQSDRNVKFFRYDRMALGDANTERESGTSRLVTVLEVLQHVRNRHKHQVCSGTGSREFVRSLVVAPESDLESLMNGLNCIQQELEKRTMIHISP